ncbi:hypothetical protein [Rhodococcus sp. IEGM 1330]|uniref:hypothetical protein n=1 Tax=Rhodococcus sp. IEGM 1330 TaxID=3082225 RepID=UPI0029546637|nr:hypothetical protein [Rhodococcus sp. IEGM 1330]MDV8023227.1 hypothetical protein [Rhodococcus sp. IEGM 1330]
MTSDTPDQDLARLARAVFDAQPFTRSMARTNVSSQWLEAPSSRPTRREDQVRRRTNTV